MTPSSRPSTLALAGLALSLVACVVEPTASTPTADDDLAVTVPTRVSTAPSAVRWEDRDERRRLWRADSTRAVVVLGPSATPRRFVAYGVDGGDLRWVFDIALRDYQDFLAVETEEWTETVGFDNAANHGIAGSVKSPGPVPPQPGEPPFRRTVEVVTQIADGIDGAIELGKLGLDQP
jgi:hypothetical protein